MLCVCAHPLQSQSGDVTGQSGPAVPSCLTLWSVLCSGAHHFQGWCGKMFVWKRHQLIFFGSGSPKSDRTTTQLFHKEPLESEPGKREKTQEEPLLGFAPLGK